jgi:hypothetical protein
MEYWKEAEIVVGLVVCFLFPAEEDIRQHGGVTSYTPVYYADLMLPRKLIPPPYQNIIHFKK